LFNTKKGKEQIVLVQMPIEKGEGLNKE